ncbi:uncharacterized protein LOC118273575 [Spodoptera frugiperda]|uniref:Uncharacterized protein LOC118273575 n=1 Tax=Spodoptera frugiperda TaxID=7108 RepID=A0A9R0DAL5_SPOFR|nr:uncharacterized protein LOC118273575 [Spodoptera frugiperda]
MENSKQKIKNLIQNHQEFDFIQLLRAGFDPNLEGGWPIRLAARHGCTLIVEALLQFGANPHLLSESGASTLQLAVFSGEHWETDKWTPLLSCCDSSQLADGAAVAIIFNNVEALNKILTTGRCNTNIPTTLTGKTLEVLAKAYKLSEFLNTSPVSELTIPTTTTSSRMSRQERMDHAPSSPFPSSNRNLSPSVAHFFNQTAHQSSLSPSRSTMIIASPSRDANRRLL